MSNTTFKKNMYFFKNVVLHVVIHLKNMVSLVLCMVLRMLRVVTQG